MSIIFNQIHHKPDTFFISRKTKYRYNRVACYKYIVSLYLCKMKLQITRILVSLRLVYQRETKTFVISNTGKKLEAMEWIHAVTGPPPPPPCLPLPPTWRIRLIAEKKSTSTSYQSAWPRSPVRRTRCAFYPKLGTRAIQTGRKWHRRNPPSHLFPLLLPARLSITMPHEEGLFALESRPLVSKFVQRKRKYFVSREIGKRFLVRENDNWIIYYPVLFPAMVLFPRV